MVKNIIISFVLLSFVSCYEPERKCSDFKNGEFSFTTNINGKENTTRFIRTDTIEVDYFNGKTDTSSVRWINDCEYIVKKAAPKNIAEEKSIHMKILATTKNTYTFEYSIVGDPKKSKGIALKIN